MLCYNETKNKGMRERKDVHMERNIIGDDFSLEKHPFVKAYLDYYKKCSSPQEPHITTVKQSFKQLQDCCSKKIKGDNEGNKTVDVPIRE